MTEIVNITQNVTVGEGTGANQTFKIKMVFNGATRQGKTKEVRERWDQQEEGVRN